MPNFNIGNTAEINMGRPNARANGLLVAMIGDADSTIEIRMSTIYRILGDGLGIMDNNKSDPKYIDIIPTLYALLNDPLISVYMKSHIGKDELYIHPVMKAIYQEMILETQSRIVAVQENIAGTLGTPTN